MPLMSMFLDPCALLLLLLLSLSLLPHFVQRQIIHMLNGVVILKRLMKLPKWLISQKRGIVVARFVRSFARRIRTSHAFFGRFSLQVNGWLCHRLWRCRLQVSAHIKPNDYNLLRDYKFSCISWVCVHFSAVKRCLINYTWLWLWLFRFSFTAWASAFQFYVYAMFCFSYRITAGSKYWMAKRKR